MNRVQIQLGDVYLSLLPGVLPDKFIMAEGPRGTGKTFAELVIEMSYALENPCARILLARSTRTRLTETVLETLEKQVFPAFGMTVPGDAGKVNRHSYILPNGSEFIPMGLDDPQRTTSLEVARIYVSEVIEIPLRSQVESLAGALRQRGMPHRRCLLDTNPGAPGHWTNEAAEPVPKHWRRVNTPAEYQRLLDHSRKPAKRGFWKRIVTRHHDNPGYFDVRKWQWTPEGREYLSTLEMFTGHLRRRWLDGDWVAAEGTVYPSFDEDVHVVPPFPVPGDWPQYVGWDAGFDHPTAILWFAVAPNGCIYIIDEIYQGGRSVTEHCASVHNRNGGRTVLRYYGDPQHCFSSTAQSPDTIADQAAKCGIRMTPWPRTAGNEEAMVEEVRGLLNRKDAMTLKPTPGLKVFAACRNTINEFQSWSYKRDARGQTPAGEDKFEDRNNDAMDVVKGVVATHPVYETQKVRVNVTR